MEVTLKIESEAKDLYIYIYLCGGCRLYLCGGSRLYISSHFFILFIIIV